VRKATLFMYTRDCMLAFPDGCSLATPPLIMTIGCFGRNCLQGFLLLHKGKAVLPGLVSFVADKNETL